MASVQFFGAVLACTLAGAIAAPSMAAAEVPLPQPKPSIPGSIVKPMPKPRVQSAPGPAEVPDVTVEKPAIPVPQPRPETAAPAEVPDADMQEPQEPQPEQAEQPETEAPVEAKPAAPPRPPFDKAAAAACEAELRSLGAGFSVGEEVTGEGSCGLERPIHLKSLKGEVAVTGNPVITCVMALGLAQWMQQVVIPSAELHLKSRPAALNIGTSYQCRYRNSSSADKLSEHAFGNAVDISGLTFAERGPVQVQVRTDDTPDRAFQAAIRGGACAYFTTVLGPTTNEAHATHLHLDAIARRGGYRLCE